MTELKRDEIKYIRDLSKSAYEKGKECFVCSSTTELQFHHVNSLTLLWNKWKKENSITINCVEDIKIERENFKGVHYKEIYADTLTLCKDCHMNKLHKIYGKTPSLATAAKQLRWAQRMKDKHGSSTTKTTNS